MTDEKAPYTKLVAKLKRGEGTRDQDTMKLVTRHQDPVKCVENHERAIEELEAMSYELREIQP